MGHGVTTASDGVEFTAGPLDRSSTFYVAGHRGLVGSAMWRRLEAAGFTIEDEGRRARANLRRFVARRSARG